jgi:hypothetical protein
MSASLSDSSLSKLGAFTPLPGASPTPIKAAASTPDTEKFDSSASQSKPNPEVSKLCLQGRFDAVADRVVETPTPTGTPTIPPETPRSAPIEFCRASDFYNFVNAVNSGLLSDTVKKVVPSSPPRVGGKRAFRGRTATRPSPYTR